MSKYNDFKNILTYFKSENFINYVRNIFNNDNIQLLPNNDPNQISILYYYKKNDNINFHWDSNKYTGNLYGAIYTIINQNNNNDLSNCKFEYFHNNTVSSINAKPNTITFFRPDILFHGVTPINDGETRIVIACYMTDNIQLKSVYSYSAIMNNFAKYIFYDIK
jgi:hypothetical protein